MSKMSNAASCRPSKSYVFDVARATSKTSHTEDWAMGPNRRAQERERAAARAAAEAKRAEAERKAIAEAEQIVAIWKRAAGWWDERCGSTR